MRDLDRRRGLRAAALPLVTSLVLASLLAACGDDIVEPRDRAVDQLEVPSADEEEARAKFDEAKVLLAAAKPRLAEPLLRRVVELTPNDLGAVRALAKVCVDLSRLDDAIPLLRRAVALDPKDTVSHDLLVRSLKGKGDAEGAETACRVWTGALPDDEEAFFQLGTILLEAGRPKEAIAALRRAEILTARRADIRTQLGLAFAANGQFDRAEQKLRDALQRDPHSADAWFKLGDVLTRFEPPRLKEAAEAMEHAVKENDRLVHAHLYLYRLAKLSQLPAGDPLLARAERSWTTILRLHGRAQLSGPGLTSRDDGSHDVVANTDGAPRDPADRNERDGRDEEASEYVLREAVTERPDDPAARFALARFLHRERRWDVAADASRRTLELRGAPVAGGTQPPPSDGSAPPPAPGGGDVWKIRCRLAAVLLADPGERGARDDGGAVPSDGQTPAPPAAPGTAGEPLVDASPRADEIRRAERATRLSNAERELRAAALAAPAVVLPRRLHAWSLLALDLTDEALAACDAALAIDPSDTLTKKLRGLVLMRRGDVDAGLQEIAAAGWLE